MAHLKLWRQLFDLQAIYDRIFRRPFDERLSERINEFDLLFSQLSTLPLSFTWKAMSSSSGKSSSSSSLAIWVWGISSYFLKETIKFSWKMIFTQSRTSKHRDFRKTCLREPELPVSEHQFEYFAMAKGKSKTQLLWKCFSSIVLRLTFLPPSRPRFFAVRLRKSVDVFPDAKVSLQSTNHRPTCTKCDTTWFSASSCF